MTTPTLGIDVSKDKLDASLRTGQRTRAKVFANTPEGWRHMTAWLKDQGIEQARVCLEATGRYSLGIAQALHDAGHGVSIVNPAQIRDFARTKLGRNKTDGVDAGLIGEYAEIFTPPPWLPPSPALRRLGELQTMRAGLVAGQREWINRRDSGIIEPTARALADTMIQAFTSQLAAADKAIAATIDADPELRARRDLLLSISGVGPTLAGILLAELPGPEVLGSAAEAVAYAGLNPRHHQSGSSLNRPTRISRIGNAVLRAALFMPAMTAMRYNPAVAALTARLKAQGRLKGKQILVAAMRKLLAICVGVLKTGKPFDPALAMPR
jgi:transposase